MKTTEFPVERAGKTIQDGMDMGKFDGVMAAHTPRGSRWITDSSDPQ